MIISLFLHFYQPAEQQEDILEMVVNQSYRPVLRGLKNSSKSALTLNVAGSLLELFDKYKYFDVLELLRDLGNSGKVEFTGSAKYHAFLPLIPDSEIERQIQAHDEVSKFYLGDAYKPKGFFPPEMGYSRKVADIISERGFEWLIVDEIAAGNSAYVSGQSNEIYKLKNSNLKVFLRDRRLSNLIMSALVRTKTSLFDTLKNDLSQNKYLIAGMDGETFGHHRPGLEKLLFELLDASETTLVALSNLVNHFHTITELDLVDSTWASSREDIEANKQFLSWKDPDNVIHKHQWEFLYFASDEVYKLSKSLPYYAEVRNKLDMALASDHFWWASAKPWWSAEMVEYGAYALLDTMYSIKNLPKDKVDKARKYYEDIVSTAFGWQRTGKVRKMARDQSGITRIPFKERTLEKGGSEVGIYHAFIDMLKDLEQKAAKVGEYEKAILWRDAIYKLENKHDIYDAINAIDLLRQEIPYEEVEKTLDKYTEPYKKIRGGQPEQRGA